MKLSEANDKVEHLDWSGSGPGVEHIEGKGFNIETTMQEAQMRMRAQLAVGLATDVLEMLLNIDRDGAMSDPLWYEVCQAVVNSLRKTVAEFFGMEAKDNESK